MALSTSFSGQAERPASLVRQDMRVILLGTQGVPQFSAQRLEIGTLVLAGKERLLFHAGRSITTGHDSGGHGSRGRNTGVPDAPAF